MWMRPEVSTQKYSNGCARSYIKNKVNSMEVCDSGCSLTANCCGLNDFHDQTQKAAVSAKTFLCKVRFDVKPQRFINYEQIIRSYLGESCDLVRRTEWKCLDLWCCVCLNVWISIYSALILRACDGASARDSSRCQLDQNVWAQSTSHDLQTDGWLISAL